MTERNIFGELMQGMQELQSHQAGKTTLKSHRVARRLPATLAQERGTGPYPAECPDGVTVPDGAAKPRKA